MNRIGFALCFAFFLALGAVLTAQSGPGSRAWRISEAPADFKPAIGTADAVIIAQHEALLGQLTRALREGGPTLAIRTCHLDATSTANWISRQRGYALGRTSDRLRSPTNTPRPWAASIVKEYAGRQAADVEGFAVDLGDRVGVLRPIVMRPVCAGCHGPADKISPAVRQVLNEQYPSDHATGFRAGEIRGWYWAEIPKAAR